MTGYGSAPIVPRHYDTHGMLVTRYDEPTQPPPIYVCDECGTDEDHCLATKHATGTACCDRCEARAAICPPSRHASPDMDGLTLAMHERGMCGCGRER